MLLAKKMPDWLGDIDADCGDAISSAFAVTSLGVRLGSDGPSMEGVDMVVREGETWYAPETYARSTGDGPLKWIGEVSR